MADIEERLLGHHRAFEGLLALTPSKVWDNGDQSDQWARKKASKEQRKLARQAKLDPDSAKSAKDLMDESDRKRKRENEVDAENVPESAPSANLLKQNGVPALSPAKRQKLPNKNRASLAKVDESTTTESKPASERPALAAKNVRLQSKADAAASNKANRSAPNKPRAKSLSHKTEQPEVAESEPSVSTELVESSEPPADTQLDQPASVEPVLPEIDKEALRARLHAKIEALRAARKADGIDGKPARTRQELIEARRQKEAEKKALKKQRRKQAQDEQKLQNANEEELARLRGSGSPVSDLLSPAPVEVPTALSFGRVAFDDGAQLDQSMEAFLNPRKRQRLDVKAALNAAERKRDRLESMDEEKRAEIAEKDMWLNAKKKAHGEKLRDNVDLLKKAVKRKEKVKSKSSKEWYDRMEAVQKGKEQRQKKREDNLKKRREEKGGKKGKKGKKKVGRPGFEGAFKSGPKR